MIFFHPNTQSYLSASVLGLYQTKRGFTPDRGVKKFLGETTKPLGRDFIVGDSSALDFEKIKVRKARWEIETRR